jgi:hypothetical protein
MTDWLANAFGESPEIYATQARPTTTTTTPTITTCPAVSSASIENGQPPRQRGRKRKNVSKSAATPLDLPGGNQQSEIFSVGSWVQVGCSVDDITAKLEAERGIRLVWDATASDFEGVTPEMLNSSRGLRCSFAARQVDNVVQLRPCIPRQLKSEMAQAHASLNAMLSGWLSRRLKKYFYSWQLVASFHVACVQTALAALTALVEASGFVCETYQLQTLPSVKASSAQQQQLFESLMKLDVQGLRDNTLVRLVAVHRNVYFCVGELAA